MALIAALLAAALAIAPPEPPPAVAARLGQYGEGDALVTVYEAQGRLHAFGPGRDGPEIPSVTFDHGDLMLNGRRLPRRDPGAEMVRRIQAGVSADPAAVRARALAASPPVETGKRPPDLVDVTTVDPRIRLDIRYAGRDNFMGFPLYERAAAYLQRPAAEALGRVQARLAAQGFGLLVHDGYRPWFVTKMFWDATPPEDHMFVADPAQGSRHNRGCAVDLTLYDLKTGRAVVMTGRYDEMSDRSYADFRGGAARQRWLRGVLRTAMEAEGFQVLPEEWWHFDYRDWAVYGIGDVTFTDLAARAQASKVQKAPPRP